MSRDTCATETDNDVHPVVACHNIDVHPVVACHKTDVHRKQNIYHMPPTSGPGPWSQWSWTLTVLTKIFVLQMENICLSNNFHPHYECMGLTNDSVCDAFTGLIYRLPSPLQLSWKLIGKIIQFQVET